MSESAKGPESTSKPAAAAPKGPAAGGVPGRSTLTQAGAEPEEETGKEGGKKPALFDDAPQWETLDGGASDGEGEAKGDHAAKNEGQDKAEAGESEQEASSAGDVEAEAEADDVAEATVDIQADAHMCHHGCAHAQFGRMMQAYTSNAVKMIDDGALEAAVQKWKAKKQATQPAGKATEGTARPGPDLTAPSSGEHGDAGTVGPGKPGGFPGKVGLATWNYGNFGYPTLDITTAKQSGGTGYEASIKSTTSRDAPTSAIATPAGTYQLGFENVPIDGKPVRMRKQVELSDSVAAEIVTAEQEHLDDVTRAYEITLKAAEDAVNAEASNTFSGTTKKEATAAAKEAVKGRLHTRLGASAATWRQMLQTCANLTKSGRDASGWHTFNYRAEADDIDIDAKVVTYRFQSNPNVGSTSSSSLITL